MLDAGYWNLDKKAPKNQEDDTETIPAPARACLPACGRQVGRQARVLKKIVSLPKHKPALADSESEFVSFSCSWEHENEKLYLLVKVNFKKTAFRRFF